MQFGICMGTADNITEMMNKGLVDIGLFLGPISTEELAYIRLQKEVITKEDLLDLLLILQNARMYKENWLEKEFSKLNIVFISNLGMNAGIMAMNGLGYPIPY